MTREKEDFAASVKRFITIFVFIFSLFIIFDTSQRDMMGRAVGAIFDPLFSFDHRYPVFTFFPAAVVTVLITSILRHYLMDWKKMARIQHMMGHLNKELFKATKANNLYKIKKLNEVKQSPEFIKLQQEQMTGTWRVMGPTMLIAVSIFAWMFSFASAPVAFSVEAPEGTLAIAWDGNPLAASVLRGGETMTIPQRAAFYLFGPAGEASIVRSNDGKVYTGPVLATPDLAAAKAVELAPGPYTAEVAMAQSDLATVGHRLFFPLLFIRSGDTMAVHRIWPLTLEGQAPAAFNVAQGEELSLVIPSTSAADSGSTLRIVFHGPTESTVDLGRDAVWLMPPTPTVHVVSKEGRVPWATFDLNATTVLPNWILLYSLFTIPFGYLFQKGLKAIEYRRQLQHTTTTTPSPE